MKIIVATDKFKGSLTSFAAADAIANGIKQVDKAAIVECFPMADGGDGFAAVLKYYWKTDSIHCNTKDPLLRDIVANYEWDDVQKLAIIEMAVASGLVLLKDNEKNPLNTSTVGTGLIIKAAIEHGAKKIILGLGGSATNDAGIGILTALGFVFLDASGLPVAPIGKNLSIIESIIVPPQLPDIVFEIACDVQHPLYGPTGAAYVFAAQKGANQEAIFLLDEGLKKIHQLIEKMTCRSIATIPGTGAAGGIAAGLMAFFEVHLQSGMDIVMKASGLEAAIQNASLIITGEGSLDQQSIDGKVIGKLVQMANENYIPIVACCGVVQLTATEINELGLNAAYSIQSEGMSKEDSMKMAAALLSKTTAAFISNYK